MPQGLEIRPADEGDYAAYCRLLPELETGDPIPDREAWIQGVMPGTLVVEARDVGVIAASWFRVVGTWGHVVTVMVDRAWRRKGVGTRLMGAIAARLREAGCRGWHLNVKRSNEPALRLYASCGLRIHRETTVLFVPWGVADGLPGEERETRLAAPEEDAALEERWALLPGSLEAARARGELPLCPEGRAEALAILNPAFPGAWFFAVERPTLAPPLLRAMRAHAPGAGRVSVVLEGADLARRFLAAGAELRMELYQLRGELPPGPAA